jgi:hypothetical protein
MRSVHWLASIPGNEGIFFSSGSFVSFKNYDVTSRNSKKSQGCYISVVGEAITPALHNTNNAVQMPSDR